MRPSIALLVLVMLTVALCACGSTDTTVSHSSSSATAVAATSTSTTVTDLTKMDADRDNDLEAPADDKNHNTVLNGGSAASPSEEQAITALVKRYYDVALAEEGAKACGMIYSPLAESVPEDYGSFAGPSYMRGTTCPAVLTLMFKHFHSLLAIELPKLHVARVRLVERHGTAILSFGPSVPERLIGVVREGHVWRVAALFDSELP